MQQAREARRSLAGREAFTVLPPVSPSRPQALRVAPRRHRKASFVILAERPLAPPRDPSPGGRVSPHRGRGFVPPPPRPASETRPPPPARKPSTRRRPVPNNNNTLAYKNKNNNVQRPSTTNKVPAADPLSTGENTSAVSSSDKNASAVGSNEKNKSVVSSGVKNTTAVSSNEKNNSMNSTGVKNTTAVSSNEKNNSMNSTGVKNTTAVSSNEKNKIVVSSGVKSTTAVSSNEKNNSMVSSGVKSTNMVSPGVENEPSAEDPQYSDGRSKVGDGEERPDSRPGSAAEGKKSESVRSPSRIPRAVKSVRSPLTSRPASPTPVERTQPDSRADQQNSSAPEPEPSLALVAATTTAPSLQLAAVDQEPRPEVPAPQPGAQPVRVAQEAQPVRVTQEAQPVRVTQEAQAVRVAQEAQPAAQPPRTAAKALGRLSPRAKPPSQEKPKATPVRFSETVTEKPVMGDLIIEKPVPGDAITKKPVKGDAITKEPVKGDATKEPPVQGEAVTETLVKEDAETDTQSGNNISAAGSKVAARVASGVLEDPAPPTRAKKNSAAIEPLVSPPPVTPGPQCASSHDTSSSPSPARSQVAGDPGRAGVKQRVADCLASLKCCCSKPDMRCCSIRSSHVGRWASCCAEPPSMKSWCGALLCRRPACSCCRRSAQPDPDRRRSIAALSKKQSQASSQLPQETGPKLDPSLVEHASLIRGAIPVLPVPLAWICLVFNVFIPGLGTLSSGLLCLCFGKPRFSVRDEPQARVGACCLDMIVAVGQMFTILFCLVGWGWSIWWGVIMVKLAKKQKKIKLMEQQQTPPVVMAVNHEVERV